MYYYLLLNKLPVNEGANAIPEIKPQPLIEAQFNRFARIWMQQPIWLRFYFMNFVTYRHAIWCLFYHFRTSSYFYK